MSTLTRGLKDQHTEHWLVFADDIRIGSIGKRFGVPTHVDQRQWTAPVYVASHRGIGNQGVLQRREAFERLCARMRLRSLRLIVWSAGPSALIQNGNTRCRALATGC